jgi:hypothetical protein
MLRITTVRPLGELFVVLGLTDGTSRLVNLEPLMKGPVFEPLLADAALFRSVRVDPTLGTITWPNGADLDPDVLLGVARPAPLP